MKNDLIFKDMIYTYDTYVFPSHKNIHAVFDSMNVELGLSGLSF